jgi:hypothetical protein
MSFVGIILVCLPSFIVSVLSDKDKILKKDDFLKQIFIPSFIGLIFLMISSYMLLKDVTDELFFQLLIGVTVILSVGINSIVIFLSMLRMRWAAD